MAKRYFEELEEGESHPASLSALKYLRGIQEEQPELWKLFKKAVAGGDSRLYQVLAATIERFQSGDFMSDRELLGLAFIILYSVVKLKQREVDENPENAEEQANDIDDIAESLPDGD
jgi:hypothetical protein